MRRALVLAAANAAVLAAACLTAVASPPERSVAAPAVAPAATPAPILAPTPSPVVAPTAAPPRRSPAPSPSRTAAPPRRTVLRTDFAPYAQAGPVVLHLPGDVVELVGLHESGHDGAQPQSPLLRDRLGLLASRSRGTGAQGAADIVLDPGRAVRSPVSGTVLRAGTYALYCDEVDEYLVVEPDARPGWEVKLLHVVGLQVRAGDRVQAGATVVARAARPLPFASQIDDHTVAPHWPHVHVEVVDPAVPDRPSGRSCD